MSLKAVLFDFNGVIIKDGSIHIQLIDDILVQENLQPQRVQERQAFLGIGSRAYLQNLLKSRGRMVTEAYMTQLLTRKAQGLGEEYQVYKVRVKNSNIQKGDTTLYYWVFKYFKR